MVIRHTRDTVDSWPDACCYRPSRVERHDHEKNSCTTQSRRLPALWPCGLTQANESPENPGRFSLKSLARLEGLEPPTTWFEVTATNSTFQLEQSLAMLAAIAKPT